MELYAEITNKMLAEIEGGVQWALPAGVVLTRRHGSRACSFECEDKIAASDLMEFLSDRGIAWQVISEERDGKRTKKEDSKKEKSYAKDFKAFKGFEDFKDPWHKNDSDDEDE